MASTHDQGLGADEINLHTSVDTDNFCTGRSSTSIGSVDTVITNPLGPSNVLSGEKRHDGQDLRFLQSGDVLIVTGMPPGSIFGFDTTSFTLAKGCHYSGGVRGVRDIPPGPHFIYGGSSSELSTRNGFWIISQCRTPDEHGEVFVKRWDSYSETLEDEISASEVKIQRDNLPEIFNSLLPYGTFQGQQSPTNSLGVKDAGMWNRLTFAIKDTMLTRITGQPWNKWHVSSSQEVKNKEVNSPDSKINTLHDLAGGLEFAFPRTRVTFSNKVIGRARTEQAMDTSAHITSIIRERCTYEDEIIGELQFSYLNGVLLGNIECQEQWAYAVKVIFKAFRLAMDMPMFFRKVIETIHTQLIFDEEAIEGSIFDHNIDFQDDLKITVFKSRLNEQMSESAARADLTEDQIGVGKAFEVLESWLLKHGWDLGKDYLRSGKIQLEDGEFVDVELEEFEAEDERGEYAPVVVDLEDDGREKGLIRW